MTFHSSSLQDTTHTLTHNTQINLTLPNTANHQPLSLFGVKGNPDDPPPLSVVSNNANLISRQKAVMCRGGSTSQRMQASTRKASAIAAAEAVVHLLSFFQARKQNASQNCPLLYLFSLLLPHTDSFCWCSQAANCHPKHLHTHTFTSSFFGCLLYRVNTLTHTHTFRHGLVVRR